MSNPRDFIPAKYKKNQKDIVSDVVDNNGVDSPWSDLAKTPKIPEYRNSEPTKPVTKNNDQINTKLVSSNNIQKKRSENKLAGILVVFFLVIGLASSYFLSKQSQDNRQKAFEPECDTSDPYCSGGRCISGYSVGSNGECVKDETSTQTCSDGYHYVYGHCIPTQCQDRDGDGQYVCGYGGDTDPCTEDSMGGDWCTDSVTHQAVSCESLGMIRCQCAAGSSNGYWVIGTGSSCSDLCGEAGINCPDCNDTPTPTPTNNPSHTPTPTASPTPTPTPVPTLLSCGETGCHTNDDCESGLTCQTVSIDGSSQGICALGSNQLFCAASPTEANCCEAQAMPTCASIDVLDSNNNLMEGNDDDNLNIGDSVRFRCTATGNQGVTFNYEFRIWAKETNYWTNLTDTSGTVAKNVSDSYIITTSGDYIAQGRICWESECQPWETVSNAPTTTRENE